jgi:DNA-binding response OmpR family regulator
VDGGDPGDRRERRRDHRLARAAVGADAYLTKPLDVDEFLRAVERFLPE